MNQEQVRSKVELISQIFPNYYFAQATNEVVLYCPQCEHHKRKLVISLEKDLFHCWVCDYGGHISKLIRAYGSEVLWREWRRIIGEVDFDFDLRDFLMSAGQPPVRIGVGKLSLPIEAHQLKTGVPSILAKNALHFLLKRGLTYRTIRMFNFHYAEDGKYKDRVIMPSYDEKGKLNFFVARSIFTSSDILKYVQPNTPKEEIIFNELMITWERPIVLVEGPFDAVAVNWNSIPLLGSSLSEKSALFKKIMNYKPEVILMLDNDDAGKEGTIRAGKILTDWGIRCSIVEYLGKDPGDLPRKEIIAAIKKRKDFTQSDIMRRILE
jgi:DNA primase